MDCAPVLVRHDLEFDMVRIDDQLLDVDRAVPESFLRFQPRVMKGWTETRFVARRPHAATAAAGDGFDHERITNLARDFQCILLGFDDPVAAWRDRNARLTSAGAR